MANPTQDQSLVHREMARRAQDVHRVHNPLDTAYKLVWDGFVDTIPAKSDYDLETYKMEKFLEEMSGLVIRQKIQDAVDAENKRRADQGEKQMEKWTGEAQHVLEGKIATELNNPENLSKLYKELYLGLVKEYGMEQVDREEAVATPTTHEQIMEDLLKQRRIVDTPHVVPPIVSESKDAPLEDLNQFKLRALAKEKGIATSNTDKKTELIAKISQS